jgi:hypothetical protein
MTTSSFLRWYVFLLFCVNDLDIHKFLCNGLIVCDMVGTLYCGVGLHAVDVLTTYGLDRLTVFLKVSRC